MNFPSKITKCVIIPRISPVLDFRSANTKVTTKGTISILFNVQIRFQSAKLNRDEAETMITAALSRFQKFSVSE